MSATTLTRQKSRRSLKSFFPILQWLPKYQASYLRVDVIAALTVWALLVPEAMAYAGIAGMPPETGLYAAPLALLGYAIFGTSRHLNVGPSSTVAALSLSVVVGFAAVGSPEFISLTVALAILTGILLVIGGLLRLGVLADFLSRPVLDGFIVGVAITVAVGQLDKLLGFIPEHPNFVPELLAFIGNLGQTHGPTFIVGMISLAALFLMHRYTPKIPAALTVMVLAILASGLLDLESYGIHIVGEIPAGLPPFGLPGAIPLNEILALLPGAAAIALVAFSESIAVARTYATRFNYKVQADQELIALGASNAGSGFSGGFVVDGSLSKTAASVDAGATTQMVSIIAGIAVLITAAFLTPLFYYLPEATLAAIVIHAVLHLISYRPVWKYRKVTPLDFWTALVATLGVLALGILQGLLLAVFLGLLGLLIGSKKRTTSVLGKVPGEVAYRALENFPEGETYPGLLIARFDGSLFFANAPEFADELRMGVEVTEPSPRVILVDAESINDIDATAVITIKELEEEFERVGVDLRFAHVKTHVMDIMRRAGIEEAVEPQHFYITIQDGVDAFLAEPERVDENTSVTGEL
ncbi:MAG: sulfate permease [Chloroflexota bacterium]|nr:sulfate permease [Chloroflexota bacterium]